LRKVFYVLQVNLLSLTFITPKESQILADILLRVLNIHVLGVCQIFVRLFLSFSLIPIKILQYIDLIIFSIILVNFPLYLIFYFLIIFHFPFKYISIYDSRPLYPYPPLYASLSSFSSFLQPSHISPQITKVSNHFSLSTQSFFLQTRSSTSIFPLPNNSASRIFGDVDRCGPLRKQFGFSLGTTFVTSSSFRTVSENHC